MLRGFGAHCAFALAAGLLAGTCEVQAAGNDANICIKESGDAAIDACSRAIQSKHYSGHVLARQYLSRGVERRAKEDYEAALADFAEAAKIDKKYADAVKALRKEGHFSIERGLPPNHVSRFIFEQPVPIRGLHPPVIRTHRGVIHAHHH